MAGPARLAPEFRVKVKGADLPPATASKVAAVEVCQDVAVPSMFAFQLIDREIDDLHAFWADDNLFTEGNEAEVLMGYAGHLESVIVGEITGLEPEFASGEVPLLTVRGYDRRHRLLRGRKTRSFTQVKDSDIASQVAQEAGLTAEAEDTQVTHDYVLQHDQTDLEFLESRARRLGFEVVVEAKTLRFRPHQNAAGEVLTLARDKDLLEFHPRLSAVGQVGEVGVQGWGPKDKKAIAGKAAAADVGAKMGGSESGPEAGERAFGAAKTAAVDWPVATQGEADQIAAGALKEMALAYVTGEGVAIGRTDLKAGAVIKIEGFGKRFSGLYYLPSVRHSYAPRRGYRTTFTVRRNAT